MNDEKIHQMEITQIKMKGDIEHIQDRLDKGIGVTITKIFDMLNEMTPQVKENSYWVGVFKRTMIWIATCGVIGGAIGLAFFIIKKGM